MGFQLVPSRFSGLRPFRPASEALALRRPQLEPRILEMAVERKRATETPSFHKDEGDAIGEADFLIRILLEQLERVVLVLRSRAEYLQGFRGIECPCTLCGKGVRAAASEKGEGLIENEITGVAVPVATNERLSMREWPFRDVRRERGNEPGTRRYRRRSLPIQFRRHRDTRRAFRQDPRVSSLDTRHRP